MHMQRTETDNTSEIIEGMVQCCFLGALLYPLWFYLDWAQIWEGVTSEATAEVKNVAQRLAWTCAGIRATVVLIMFVYIYSVLRSKQDPGQSSRKGLIIFGAVTQQSLGLGIILIIWFLNSFPGNYFAGLVMVFIVISILTPWNPKWTILQITILTFSYGIAGYLKYTTVEMEVPNEVYTNIVFLAGAGVLCCYGAFVSNRVRQLLEAKSRGEGPPERLLMHLPGIIRKTLVGAAIVAAPILALLFYWLATRW